MKTTIGVLFGCPSVEHEVAVISALRTMEALDPEKYDIFPIYITKTGEWYWGEVLTEPENFKDIEEMLEDCEPILVSPNLKDGTVFVYPRSFISKRPLAIIDIFMPVTHGAYGEDGCLQGFLELTGLPYTGPGVLSAAVGMDKVAQKALCKMGGVPVLDCFWFYGPQWSDGEDDIVEYIERKFSYPVVVKPANLGSSIGVSLAQNREELVAAVENAVQYTDKLLVEKAVTRLRELNIAVLGDVYKAEVSAIEETVAGGPILTFADKYVREDGIKIAGMESQNRHLPADITAEQATAIENYALDAFYCLNGTGVWRFDFLLDEATGKIYLNEVNTIPGSLAYYLWEPKGVAPEELMERLIRIALREKQRQVGKITSFRNNLLVRGDLGED